MMSALSTDDSTDRLQSAVANLLEKYAVSAPPRWKLRPRPDAPIGPFTMLPGWTVLDQPLLTDAIPLLPWRSERRFLELKRMVDDRVVEPLLMCRFCCMTDGSPMPLAAVLYREFDLAEWLAGSPIAAISASIQAGHWANVILRLANGVICGVEASDALPAGAAAIDRHELIARRGVACDRVVDTQVPQSSVYTLTAAGVDQYTDVDAELFGLPNDDVFLVRAAFDALAHPEHTDALRGQHCRLAGLVRLAFESDRRRERLAVKGDC